MAEDKLKLFARYGSRNVGTHKEWERKHWIDDRVLSYNFRWICFALCLRVCEAVAVGVCTRRIGKVVSSGVSFMLWLCVIVIGSERGRERYSDTHTLTPIVIRSTNTRGWKKAETFRCVHLRLLAFIYVWKRRAREKRTCVNVTDDAVVRHTVALVECHSTHEFKWRLLVPMRLDNFKLFLTPNR